MPRSRSTKLKPGTATMIADGRPLAVQIGDLATATEGPTVLTFQVCPGLMRGHVRRPGDRGLEVAIDGPEYIYPGGRPFAGWVHDVILERGDIDQVVLGQGSNALARDCRLADALLAHDEGDPADGHAVLPRPHDPLGLNLVTPDQLDPAALGVGLRGQVGRRGGRRAEVGQLRRERVGRAVGEPTLDRPPYLVLVVEPEPLGCALEDFARGVVVEHARTDARAELHRGAVERVAAGVAIAGRQGLQVAVDLVPGGQAPPRE